MEFLGKAFSKGGGLYERRYIDVFYVFRKEMSKHMELDRQDCNVLKGLAIICIVLHNYCHVLSGAPAENEYSWAYERTVYFWSVLPNVFFINLFSFMGHYGVSIFVFLSGYGLMRKYVGEKLVWNKFFIGHYLKLLKLMLPGLVSYIFIFKIVYGGFDGINEFKFVGQVLFFSNLFQPHYLSIVPGPYWYFGLTMQIYVFFLIFRRHVLNLCIFTIFCLFLLVLSADYPLLTIGLKYNIVGSSLSFLIGVLFAKYSQFFVISFNKKVLLILIYSLF